MTWRSGTVLLGCCLAAAWASSAVAAGATPPAAGKKVEFARDVQPILADNCYFCHGPDAHHREANLRFDKLDPKEGPLAPRDGYAIVAPGKVDDSVLVMRITADDPDVHMPPPDSHRKLTDAQIELLKRWIEQGAKWGKHWSLEVPKRPEVPEVAEVPALKGRAWPRNPIDNFVLAKLQKQGLNPSPEADKETLIRRVTLDLTGLPPTPAEVDAFLADSSADAYEKVVDRLLASPRYGEHMAWAWMDLARYADTNGYQNDPTRTMWPWRDWVVKAFNENMPFDQFGTWQIAGDLLPHATQEQKLASGFNRNHPYNGEGGRIPEETRVENVLDRVDTTSTAFLGLTVRCAKCHDHKYDPISQKEYYQLYAYFNQCSETGAGKYVNEGNVPPVISIATSEQQKKLAALKAATKRAEEHLAAALPAIEAKEKAWEESARYEKGWIVATPVSAKSQGGATLRTREDSSVLASGKSPETDVYEVVLRTDLSRVTGVRVEALPDDSLPHGGPGRSSDGGNFVLTGLEASAAPLADGGHPKPVKFSAADATYSQKNFDVAGAIDNDPKTGWAALMPPDKNRLSAVFRFAEPVTFAHDRGGEVHLTFRFASQYKQHALGRFRLALTDGSAPTLPVSNALAVPPGQRSEKQKVRLRDFYRDRISTELKPLNDAVAAAGKALADFQSTLTRVMVMDDATPRETHVLVKGAYDKPAERVEPGVPAVLNPLPVEGAREPGGSAAGAKPSTARSSPTINNRLTLARWLFDPANPLTARVTVNRYWQRFFGVGIVKTVEDFGVQGERPTHPDLLDWLAVQFRQSGWDVKAMHRLIVTSATYRQSSKVTPELQERDPENRLLARGPRGRLPSPVIRDQALAAAGLLVEKVGGPPVKPYQPPGVWEEATFGIIKYKQDHGDSLYRRSLYTFWRRIVGPAEFFDVPSRSQCSVRPSRTNTPLHALTTLNDPTFVEAARNLAQRIMTTAGPSPEDRLNLAYRLVLSRAPQPKEEAVLTAALERLKQQYGADKDAAAKLLAVGESKRDASLDPVEHAAYTTICLEILNLDEALTKE
jgi:hypothetical protein